MNNNQDKMVRRYRKKEKASKGSIAVIVILITVLALALAVLVLALTGALNPVLDRLFAEETKAPAETPAVTDVTETAEPSTSPAQTSPAETEPGETTPPGTDPPLINDGEIEWEFVSLEYKDTENGILVLIDSDHPYTFPEKSGTELTVVYGLSDRMYSLSGSDIKLDKTAALQFNELAKAFFAASGHNDLMISGGYRTFEYQDSLFQRYGAGSTFAPGCTDYHSGVSLYVKVFEKREDGNIVHELEDMGADYDWVNLHAHEYGFIVRYPVGKEAYTGKLNDGLGHFRYVGVAHSTLMHEKNLCLEEYFDFLEDFTYTGNHLTVTAGGSGYEIFCVPLMADGITKVPVPTNFPYVLSGDNRGNVIVTVQR